MNRTEFLDRIGYYSVKKSIKDYFFKRRLERDDAIKKRRVEEAIYAITEPIVGNSGKSDVIVSLTSYGFRATDALPYTLYSLLMQTTLPDRILVWLDNDNWSDEKLSPILKKLQSLGVEFRYTEDIRSYKKLIPTLRLYPNSVIITVDDDMYYNERLVEWLIDAYKSSDQNTVFGTIGTQATYAEEGYKPYSQWTDKCTDDGEICLIGCGGILYPPALFDEEILKRDIFMHLAPRADDLWLWAMEKRAKAKTALTHHHGEGLHVAVNRLNVYFPAERNDNLYYENEIKGGNDIQLHNLIEYYNLKPKQKQS